MNPKEDRRKTDDLLYKYAPKGFAEMVLKGEPFMIHRFDIGARREGALFISYPNKKTEQHFDDAIKDDIIRARSDIENICKDAQRFIDMEMSCIEGRQWTTIFRNTIKENEIIPFASICGFARLGETGEVDLFYMVKLEDRFIEETPFFRNAIFGCASHIHELVKKTLLIDHSIMGSAQK